MKHIAYLDDIYPVKTLFTDSADWRENTGWLHEDMKKEEFQDRLRVPVKQVCIAREIHSDRVLLIPDESSGKFVAEGESPASDSPDGYDGLVTGVPGVLLCIWTADCLPLFLYDPGKHAAGVVHCGWRGTCGGIASKAVSLMTGQFGSDPEQIIAVFGPAICGRCYEVGGELIELFSKRFSPDETGSFFHPKQGEKFFLDLRKAVGIDLLHTGVLPENIHDEGICTYESEAYPSYRRNKCIRPVRQVLSGIVLL